MHYAVLYPLNGDCIVTIDSVMSLHPMYTSNCTFEKSMCWTAKNATVSSNNTAEKINTYFSSQSSQ